MTIQKKRAPRLDQLDSARTFSRMQKGTGRNCRRERCESVKVEQCGQTGKKGLRLILPKFYDPV